MKITTLEVAGFHSAIHAMRNPMDSWKKSDTVTGRVGAKDRELSEKLAKAGPEHAKHLRMIIVWADIEAARYWWHEFDTYRAGVEKISCSTMHRLTARPLTMDDFEIDIFQGDLQETIDELNLKIDRFERLKKEHPESSKDMWRNVIQTLPQGYKQKRTVMMSYAALRNIVRQREGHKLIEWQKFIDWAKTLPESWMIFDEEVKE